MSEDKTHVLVVEDNPGDARLVEEMLKADGADEFRLKHVQSLQEAVSSLSQGDGNHLILLDLGLPDETGLQTLRRIMPLAKDASVVVITGLQNEELGTAAIREGAVDYLIKGQVDGRQLRRILHYAIERHKMQIQLHSLSLRDDLTGLHNRRGFLFLAEQQMSVSRRNLSSCLLLFLDINGLKNINDTAGHAEGNNAILEASSVLRSSFRQCDILARIGGDEFVVLAVGTSESSEAALRAHLKQKIEAVNSQPNRKYPLSFSIGIVPCGAKVQSTVEDLLAKADALMYQDKRGKTSAGLPCPAEAMTNDR
jgi:two-component system, cell cycle response regulator